VSRLPGVHGGACGRGGAARWRRAPQGEARRNKESGATGGRRVEAERKRKGGGREWRWRGRSRARVGDSLSAAYKGEGRRMGAVPSRQRRRGAGRIAAVRGRWRQEEAAMLPGELGSIE
jgi:hypothetical protein